MKTKRETCAYGISEDRENGKRLWLFSAKNRIFGDPLDTSIGVKPIRRGGIFDRHLQGLHLSGRVQLLDAMRRKYFENGSHLTFFNIDNEQKMFDEMIQPIQPKKFADWKCTYGISHDRKHGVRIWLSRASKSVFSVPNDPLIKVQRVTRPFAEACYLRGFTHRQKDKIFDILRENFRKVSPTGTPLCYDFNSPRSILDLVTLEAAE